MREGEFNASELVSAVMMRVNAIGDGLIWRRIEALIERGLIVQVTKAEADDMPYQMYHQEEIGRYVWKYNKTPRSFRGVYIYAA